MPLRSVPSNVLFIKEVVQIEIQKLAVVGFVRSVSMESGNLFLRTPLVIAGFTDVGLPEIPMKEYRLRVVCCFGNKKS
ncbi:hypothetical protein ACFLZM_08130 [Thermodesulfobacteriota bacterium]